MTVNLGSIEVTEEQALALGRSGARGRRYPATRAEVKTFALKTITDAMNNRVRIDREESGPSVLPGDEPEPDLGDD